MFEPLKDVSYFRQMHLDVDTIAWPNGAAVRKNAKARKTNWKYER